MSSRHHGNTVTSTTGNEPTSCGQPVTGHPSVVNSATPPAVEDRKLRNRLPNDIAPRPHAETSLFRARPEGPGPAESGLPFVRQSAGSAGTQPYRRLVSETRHRDRRIPKEPSAKRCCPLEPPTIPRAGCCRRRVAGSGQRPAQRRSHSQMAVRAMKKATRPPPRHQAKSAASSSIERSEEDERCQHVELCLRMSLDPDRDAKVSVGAWSALGACAVPGVC